MEMQDCDDDNGTTGSAGGPVAGSAALSAGGVGGFAG
jgi:hypothetical protein